MQQAKKTLICLYNADGSKRKPLEVLREVQAEMQQPIIDGVTVIVDDEEVEEIKPETAAVFSHAGCVIEESDNGNIEIFPVNANKITIHGEEMLWFFICRLMDCNQ